MPQKVPFGELHSPPSTTNTVRATSMQQAPRARGTKISAVFLLLCATGVVPSINIQRKEASNRGMREKWWWLVRR